MIDHLSSLSEPEVSVSYFYLKYLDQGSLTLSTVLASLLRQALHGMTDIPKSIMELFLSHREGSKISSTADQLRLLFDVAAGPRILYVVLDALDEYDHTQRRGLLEAVKELRQCPSIRLLLTSRSHIPDLEASFSKCPQILVEAHDGDLKAYMKHSILVQNQYDIIDDEFANQIMNQFIARAKGTFLPVVLQLGTVLRKKTRGHMEDAIGSISDDLAVVFEETMARIDRLHEDYRILAKRVLAWLTHARSTLTAAELGDALSVADSVQRGWTSWTTRYRPLPRMMINCCQGLVLLEPVTNRLSLAHYTVQEHFEKHTDRLFPWAKVDFARTCLSYLLYDDFDSGPCNADEDIYGRVIKYPFLAYAAQYWGNHVADTEQEPGVADLLSKFLGQRISTAVAWQVVRYVQGYTEIYWRPEECLSATPIHTASRYGLTHTLKRLLQTDDVNNINLCTAEVKTTPVILAASEPNLGILNLLLRSGADPYISNWYGNALHCACEAGMSDNIRLLVNFGMKTNAEHAQQGRPPIFRTVDNDRLGALETLVDLVDDEEVNAAPDPDPRLLQYFLLWAVEYGAHQIVGWILGNEQHHRRVAWLLRSHYLDSLLEKLNLDADTPLLGVPVLHRAILAGDVEMVRLLVSFGADPYATAWEGKTAVDYAAESMVSALTDALGLDSNDLSVAVERLRV
nr:nacht and ankyrin domain protein [Colletotrichum truncatum]KAF6790869.1 nacht and ankyrin domain protein [Colletotrichum truncatum]